MRIRSWAQDASHDGARDEFRIDAVTGRLVSSEIYADKPIGERILASVLDIHRGSIFGWPGQLLFMVAAALMPLFMVTGFMLYLSRRKHRRMSRPTVGSLVPGDKARRPIHPRARAMLKKVAARPGRGNVRAMTSQCLEVFDQRLSIALRQLRSDHALDFLVLAEVLPEFVAPV